jgi:hypothetical protein
MLSAPNIHSTVMIISGFRLMNDEKLGDCMAIIAQIMVGMIALFQIPKKKSGTKLIMVIINERIIILLKNLAISELVGCPLIMGILDPAYTLSTLT